MRRACLALAAGLLLCSPPARAQDDVREAKPYTPVAITLTAPAADPTLDAFRTRLAEVAKQKDASALKQLVVEKGFFWDGDSEGAYDRKKSAYANLSAALVLDGPDEGAGWDNLALLAGLEAAAHGRRRNVLCAPPRPQYAAAEFERLLKQTDTEAADWIYPRAAGVTVRLYPKENSDVVDTLGMHLVLVDGFEDSRANDPQTWHIVITPRGKRGYVLFEDLLSPFVDRLCYVKDANGAWRITGYVSGGE